MKSFFTSATPSFAARFTSKSASVQPRAAVQSMLSRVRQAALGALLLGSAFLASPAVAQQQPITIDKTDAATFRVRTQNPMNERVQVQVISGVTGHRLFTETYDQAYYSRRLNFQNLKPGSYFLVTKLGQDTYRYTIQVKPTATGQVVAVRNVRVRLGNRSQQVATLNTLTPVAVSSALATNETGL
jgi:hypothetical protein